MTKELLFDERLASGSHQAPVLVLLHGWASYKGHLFELARDLDRRWTVVAPQAPVRMGPGAYRWFDFERTPDSGPIINDNEEAPSLDALLSFLERLTARLSPAALYLLGHSQGATMALSVTVQRPPWLSGCININGRLLKKRLAQVKDPNILHSLPVYCAHGTHNSIVPLRLGQESREHLQRLGATVSYREYPIGHEITTESFSDAASWLHHISQNHF
jgi:phospholipase/carboxylesterase